MDELAWVEEEVIDLAEFFSMFGDGSRLKILFTLQMGEKNVTEITHLMGMQQTAVSHQLKLLRHMRLVTYRKEGRNVLYSLNDSHVNDILSIGIAHIQEAQRV